MRSIAIFFGSFAFCLVASLAEAGWMTAVMRDMNRSHSRNHCWPQPFNLMDRQAVIMPFGLMVQNGWQKRNTIGRRYYQMETGQLNEAGKRHVRSIMTQQPRHPILYVQPAGTERETSERLESARRAAEQYATGREAVEVVLVPFEQSFPPVPPDAPSHTGESNGPSQRESVDRPIENLGKP